MKNLSLLACMTLAASASLSTQAMAETQVLTATSPWKMDYTPNACHLQRGFGTAENPALLQIERVGSGDRLYISVAGTAFKDIDAYSKVALTTGPDAQPPISTLFTLADMHSADGRTLTTVLFAGTTLNGYSHDGQQPAPVTPAREAAVTSLIVTWGKNSVQLGTGPLGKALAAMRECTDGLVKSWGLDPVQQASLSAHPKPATPSSEWIRQSAYPADLAKEGRQAIITARLMIDATGAITDCKILEDFGEPRFAKISCDQITARAHFEPARDANGQPVASYYVDRINWKVDTRPPLARPRVRR